jgi:hypothetical protein
MNPPPESVGHARVLLYTTIDARHHPTGATQHIVDGIVVGPAAALAICRYEDEPGVYLFGCTSDWQVVTDTWHETVEDARDQAEFEYTGVSDTWSSAPSQDGGTPPPTP